MEYYLKPCNISKSESKTKIKLQNNLSVIRYVRCYNGGEVTFYTDDTTSFRNMYIYIGDFLEKLVLSYIEIKEKCSNSSIRDAFEDCPNIYEFLKNYANGYSSPITFLYANNRYYYCIKRSYCTLFNSKKRIFKSLHNLAEVFRKEIPLIKGSLLKPSLKMRTKKFLADSGKDALKFVVRAGVIVAAATVGANLDLPDFDFDIDIPDVELPDFDMDYDLGADISNVNDYGSAELTSVSNGSNISFGSNKDWLERELRLANENKDHYKRAIDNFNDNTSSTYMWTCQNGYEQAAKKAKEIAEELKKLQS